MWAMAKQEKIKHRPESIAESLVSDSPKMALQLDSIAARDGGRSDAGAMELPLFQVAAADAPKIDLSSLAPQHVESDGLDPPRGEPEADELDADRADAEGVTESAHSRASRFTLLAACLALAAALGGMVGALTAYSLARPVRTAAITLDKISPEEMHALKENVVQARVELAALKVTIDANNRNASTQMAKIGERIERMERNAAEPAAKLNKAIDALDRLSRAEAQSMTGSIAPPQPASAPSNGWILRDVRRGTAFIEGRAGAFIEVEQGDVVPGLGRVESIKKQDGRWVVVTPKATLTLQR